MDDSALARVEEQRVELESNIAKLRKSLRHWQTLEIDYEGLKEEILGIPEDSSAEECLQAAKDFKPELVDEKELQALLRDNNSRSRRPAQLVDLLSKRVDYVSRNVETVRKQLSNAEKKRNALLLAEEPDHRDAAGLPLAEITEELDESGQVISSKVETPGFDAPQLIDVLKKAGIKDLKETDGTITKVDSLTELHREPFRSSEPVEKQIPSTNESQVLSTTSTGQPPRAPAHPFPTNANDTEDEAQLRREIVEYSRGLDELGTIVAELELDEDASEVSYDEEEDKLEIDSDLDNDDDDFDDDESEDEFGKSKSPLSLPRGYGKKMQELQESLGLTNVGPRAEMGNAIEQIRHDSRPPAAEAARQAAIARHDKSTKSSLKSATKKSPEEDISKRGKTEKKKVAFSSELDIAPETPTAITTPAPSTSPQKDRQEPQIRPVSESIVERTVDENEEDAPAPAPAPAAGKQSRFKAARQSQPQKPIFAPTMTFPSQTGDNDDEQSIHPTPSSKIVFADLVERPSPNVTKAPDPDDFADEAHRRGIAIEYQQHRMKRIHSQEGGFVGNGEEDNYGEMITPEDESGRKLSRFKAARVKR